MTTPITEPRTTDPTPTAWRTAPWVMACLAIALLASQLLNSATPSQPVLNWYQSSGLKTWSGTTTSPGFASTIKAPCHNAWNNTLTWTLTSTARPCSPRILSQTANTAPMISGPQPRSNSGTACASNPAQVATSNLYRWGLPDASPRPARFFTAPFTGGSLWLTLATLLVLLPLAPTLERRLGHGRVLALWILGCLLSGFGYLLLASPGQIPFHGATAPMLVWFGAFFGLQRDTLSLPFWHPKHKHWRHLPVSPYTLLPLPVAVLAALALFSDPLLANLSAGLCAFIGGLLLVQIMRPQPADTQQHNSHAPDPQQLSSLTRGWDALGQLNGDAASTAFAQILATEPDHFDALTGQFTAQQLLSDNVACQHAADALFSRPAAGPAEAAQISQHWKQYRQRSYPSISTSTGWQLVHTLSQAREFQQAEALVKQLDKHDHGQDAIKALRQALEQEGLSHRAKALTL